MKKNLKLYLDLFWTMFKTGAFTFGGGYAMISLIKGEFVDRKQWINDEELMDMITISESTPGPIAINMSTFVGYKVGGFLGSLISTIGIIIPSIVIIVLISFFLQEALSYEIVQHALLGISCAVGVLFLTAFTSLIKTMKKTWFSYTLFGLSIVVTFIVMFFNLNVSTIFILLGGALLSYIECVIRTLKNKKKEEGAKND